MNPAQTAPKELSELGPYCLQYRLSTLEEMREQTTIDLNGGKSFNNKVNRICAHIFS